MTTPTNEQIASLAAALDTFTRRYKLTDPASPKPLAEIDKQTLLFVRREPGCGPTDVARYLGVPTTTISSATDRLAKRGLLERHRQDDDRRAVALRLSQAGQDQVEALEAAYNKMFRMMLERLTPEERDSFVAMMAKISYYDP